MASQNDSSSFYLPASPISASFAALEKSKERQQELREAHYIWKRQVFSARPPPPAIGRFHRCNHPSERKYSGAHAQFSIAQALLQHHEVSDKEESQNKTSIEKSLEENASRMTPPLTTSSLLPSHSCTSLPSTVGGKNEHVTPETRKVVAPSFSSFSSSLSAVTDKKGGAVSSSVTSSACPSSTFSPSREESWIQQMLTEMSRRQPYVDLSIRSDPSRTILVANLPPDAVEEEVRQFLERFGRVTYMRVIKGWGRRRGTGKRGTTTTITSTMNKGPCQRSERGVGDEDERDSEEMERYPAPRSRRYGFAEFGLVAEAKKAIQHTRRYRLRGYAIVMDRERGRDVGFIPKRFSMAVALEKEKGRREGDEGEAKHVVGGTGWRGKSRRGGSSGDEAERPPLAGRKRRWVGLHDHMAIDDGGREDEGKEKEREENNIKARMEEKAGESHALNFTQASKKCRMEEEKENPPNFSCLALLPSPAEDDDDDFLNAILSHQDG